jgi:hypothetical protein
MTSFGLLLHQQNIIALGTETIYQSMNAVGKNNGKAAGKKGAKNFLKYRKCDSCLEMGLDVMICSCGHGYCSKCMQRMCEIALAGESAFPVTCCGAEIRHAMNSLPVESQQRFRSRLDELRATNFMYW